MKLTHGFLFHCKITSGAHRNKLHIIIFRLYYAISWLFWILLLLILFFQNEEDDYDRETLNFPFLQDAKTIEFIMNSKTMFIMRGLPGSGKSEIARNMKQVYGDLAVICSADDLRLNEQGEYIWKVEEYEETHSKCNKKASRTCEDGIPVVVIGKC